MVMRMVQTQNRNEDEDEDEDEEKKKEDEDGSDLLRVDGPVSYSCWVYRNQAGRPTLIHNFGDIHVHRSGCSTKDEDLYMSIEELIAETMHTAIDFDVIDFFFEGARHECYNTIQKQPQSEMLNQGALNRLEREFAPCLCLANMQRCQQGFPAGRIHASDIRKVLGINDQFVIPDIENKKSLAWKYFKYIVFNQIYHIKDKKIRKELSKMYSEIKALSREDLQEHTYAPLMDIYLLGRLFRSYEPLPDQTPKSAFENAPVQNAVIYSGDYHKNIYDKFFNEIGAEILYSFNSPEISKEVGPAQCVRIPTFVNDRHRLYLPMVSDFETEENPETIESLYDRFENKYKPPLNDYAITKEEKKVISLRPYQTLFYGQKFPQPKYKKPRSEEPQAKRQRIEEP